MDNYFEVGKILTTHGLKGEVKVNPITDFIEERFTPGTNLYIGKNVKDTDMQPVTVEKARMHKQFVLVTFVGIDNIDEAKTICGEMIFVKESDRQELEEGSYYYKDILGLPVYDAESGKKLGILTDIETPGANDIWEIKPDQGKSFWIPNIASVVKKVDLDNHRIEVTLLEGLRDED